MLIDFRLIDFRRIRHALPEGRTLPEDLWIRRHRGILVLLWAHAALIPLFALGRGFSVVHTLVEGAVIPLTALLATTPRLNRRLRSAAASLGLLSCSAVLVHLSGGVIEMHFHFFVMVAVVALYQDWVCFLTAIGYVLVHHGILGALDPESVFNHYAALNHPWKWAAIHAFFVTGISVACLVTWRLDENLLDREREAEERLREETRIVETLNEVGRTVAAELDLQAVIQQVTDAATEVTAAAFASFSSDGVGSHGESYPLSGEPAGAFARLPPPSEGTVRLDDVTQDARQGDSPAPHGPAPGHLPVRSYLAVPVRSARGELLGRLFLGHPEPGRFADVDERLAEGIAAHAAVAIDNARLYDAQRRSRVAAERAHSRLAVLAEASRALASSLDVGRILDELAGVVVPTMADGCAVFLADDSVLRQVAQVTATPESEHRPSESDRPPIVAADSDNPVARSFRTGQSILLSPGSGEPVMIIVPLVGPHGQLGVLSLCMGDGSDHLPDDDDVSLAEELGRRAAVAVEHARLYADQRSAAETLQHSLLPEVLPELPGIAIASQYLPGGPDVEVGGDWYDVLALPDGRLALAMGDVVGRGVPAASLMGQLRNGLRAYILEGRSPAQVLFLLNRLLREVGTLHQMATVIVMVLDPETGEVCYSNAGHPPPLLGTSDGAPQFLEDAVCVPVGAIGHAEYTEATVTLTPGSTLVLYTDGLVEHRTMSLDVGLDRLRSSLVSAPDDMDGLCAHLSAHVREAGRTQDDMAILAVRWLALGPTLDLQLPSQARVLRPLRAALRRWLAAAGVTDHEAFEILVATSEACANAIRHGAPQATHFGLRAELNGDVAIVVRSTGRWRERRPSAPGGRGLDIMRQFMDDTEVTGGDDTTEIRMRRRLVNSSPVPGSGADAT